MKDDDNKASTTASCLSPSVFLSSILNMNIIIPAPPGVDNDDDSTSSEKVQCSGDNFMATNEAIEFLRRCHGEFISLVASALVSDEQIIVNSNETLPNNHVVGHKRPHDDEVITISTVNPKRVMDALSILEFKDISDELTKNVKSDHDGDGRKKSDNLVNANIHSQEATSNDTQIVQQPFSSHAEPTIQRKRKIKHALKNRKLTEDLLKEQEKLFADSLSKAKKSLINSNTIN